MRKKQVGAMVISGFALLAVLGTAHQGLAQEATTTYSRMAPIEQYLMDRTAEIALARTAAPESISRDAAVMVLGRRGFETANEGKNGFVCIVERGWTAAAEPDFWNPKVRVPICDNAAAARSYLLRSLKTTELVLAGRTKTQIEEDIVAAVQKKELPAMEPGAMCYMMSKEGYGGDAAPHWPSHVMFFFSGVASASWGANVPGSPVMAVSDDREKLTEFAVALGHWSDGTEAR
ncbi:MAG: hypothetical protein H0X25_18215 [Acidobacteriales bacterium]|nr:hypothetical protein [Terriglobales bacterium]